MITLADVKASSAINIANVTVNSPEFLRLLNESVRRLLIRGDWSGTLVPIQVCVSHGCITWPRYVGNIRRMNVCKQSVHLRNIWYSFLEYERRGDCRSWSGWQGSWTGWLGGEAFGVTQGRYPVHTDILGDGRYVRAYTEVAADIGKTIRIFGVDNNNQPLRTGISGVWTEGIELRLATPYVQSVGYIRRIDRVVKSTTQGNVTLFAYNEADDVLEDLATYEPSETSPSYVRQRLNFACQSCSTSRSVVALIKLAHVPIRVDADLVPIDNLAALKFMMQCIQSEEANDRVTARGFEKDAIRELNLQLSDDNPDEQTPVSQEPFNAMHGVYSHRMF